MSGRLLTIGYQGTTLAAFVAGLVASHVEVLVDVRDVPWSRKPGFSKAALRNAVEAAGVGYVHLKGLGNPPEGRAAARAGDADGYRRFFTARLDRPDALADLATAATLASDKSACLMCFEHDPNDCHRKLVAERLAAMTGRTPEHLFAATGPLI